MSRAFDLAAIHGKTPTGGVGPFPDFLTMTPYTTQLGTAPQNKGGIWADLVSGMKLVVDGDDDPENPSEGYDVTGWAGDPRLRPDLLLATDANGRPIFVDTTTPGVGAVGSGSLVGYRCPTAAASPARSSARTPPRTPDCGWSAVTSGSAPTASA
ncbi:hypothetical protein ACIPXV_23070 [Streptomyces libani]|uniref:hypothetical protein n=1 Tax=Streptomyces nigrescens TaxID=1920 RepID=UPI003818058A